MVGSITFSLRLLAASSAEAEHAAVSLWPFASAGELNSQESFSRYHWLNNGFESSKHLPCPGDRKNGHHRAGGRIPANIIA